MDDLISRQAAIDALDVLCQEHRYKIPGKRETYSQYNEAWQDALDRAEGAIFNLPSAQPEQRWIPCSERLPEDTVMVTVETKTFNHKYVCEAVWIPRWTWKVEYDNWEDCSEYNEDEDEYYVLEGWYERVHNWDEYSYVGIEDDVTAWMPLPEPWRGEEHETD